MKTRTKKIILGVVVVLAAVRMVLPSIILSEANKFLGSFSQDYSLHINDLDLAIFRGAYRFEGLSGKMHKYKEPFLNVDRVDISLAWRELLKGKVQTDIVVDGMKFLLSTELLDVVKGKKDTSKKDAQNAGEKLFPMEVSRLDIKNSELQVGDVEGLPPELRWRVSQIEGRLTNAVPSKENPISLVTLKGALFDKSDLKVLAQYNALQVPTAWYSAIELRNFELSHANDLLKRKVSLTFKAGSLDLYGEIKGENNKIEGYVKPFMKKADIVGDTKDFANLKHFGIEVATATANIILRTTSKHVVATKVDFSYENDKFDWNAGQALSEAVKNGFESKLEPGIENQYGLKNEKGVLQ
jgi:hypothetical protein